MSLIVDRRIGSADLYPIFENMGLPCLLSELAYGDCAWTGIGEDGPVECAAEIKRVDDLLQCMRDGRFAGHQLPGLLTNYDRVYLIIEEGTRPGDTSGVLEHYVKGKFWHTAKVAGITYRAYERFLTTLMERGNVRIRQTINRQGTAETVAALYRWWQDGVDAHSSIFALDRSTQIKLEEQIKRERNQSGVSMIRQKIPLTRRIAAELPGLGTEKSKAAASAFKSVREMVNADVKTWMKVEGVGKGIATQIVEAVEGNEK